MNSRSLLFFIAGYGHPQPFCFLPKRKFFFLAYITSHITASRIRDPFSKSEQGASERRPGRGRRAGQEPGTRNMTFFTLFMFFLSCFPHYCCWGFFSAQDGKRGSYHRVNRVNRGICSCFNLITDKNDCRGQNEPCFLVFAASSSSNTAYVDCFLLLHHLPLSHLTDFELSAF